MVPFVNDVRNMEHDTIKLKISGDYLWNLSDGYLTQNDNLSDVVFSLHSSQFNLDDWEYSTNINNTIIDAAMGDGNIGRVLEFRERQKRLNKRASSRCNDSHLVVMITKFKGRHTRKDETKKQLRQRQYTLYVGWNIGKERVHGSNHNVMEVDDEQKNIELLDMEFPDLDDTDSKRLKKQRESFKRLLNLDAIRDIEYDISRIPRELQYLDMLCNCGHGERTLGTCAHRGGLLRGLRNKFRNTPAMPAHPRSIRLSQLQMNIEQDNDADDDDLDIVDQESDSMSDDDDVFDYPD